MIHTSVTNSIGKRVVGKQNLLPLIRDIGEDAREVRCAIDTERTRYTGTLLAVSGVGEEHVILRIPNERAGRDRTVIKMKRILAVSILEVGPDPESPAGKEMANAKND